MTVRSLLDTNMLLALFDPEHSGNARAHSWWRQNSEGGWASCPITQNGYVRIVSQPSYPSPLAVGDALDVLRRQTSLSGHEFWPDTISIADNSLFEPDHLVGHRQITDIYLLALAVKRRGRFVSLDRGVTLRAVKGAEAENLVVIK